MIKKPFIVFGFYGTGKTTFQKQYPNTAIDYDSEYILFDEFLYKKYKNSIKNDTEHILLINQFMDIEIKKISIMFIPKTKEILKKNLTRKSLQNDFINENIEHFEENINEIKEYAKKYNIPIIELNDNEYITNYSDKIFTLYNERK